jgi:tRNA (guanine37-N1)-methyltransferase
LAEASPQEESHSCHMLEYPQYTRPPDFRGWRVPDILLSGHHENIARWRRREAFRRTRQRRPDLFARLDLSSKADQKLLREIVEEDL